MATILQGDTKIFYIKDASVWVPVGCLTSNGITEDAEFLETTTRLSGGWRTTKPTNQSYTLNVEAYSTRDSGLLSYEDLRDKKRARSLVEWKIDDGTNKETGYASISQIGETAPAGELVTFSMQLIGYGVPNAVLSADPDPTDGPPEAPFLNFLSVSTTQICITWTTPASDQPINGYKIYRDGVLYQSIPNFGNNTYCDTGVVENTSYQYNVSAVSTLGEGPLSNPVINPTEVPSGGFNYFLFQDGDDFLFQDLTIHIHS